jgi:hypothetical protein
VFWHKRRQHKQINVKKQQHKTQEDKKKFQQLTSTYFSMTITETLHKTEAKRKIIIVFNLLINPT